MSPPKSPGDTLRAKAPVSPSCPEAGATLRSDCEFYLSTGLKSNPVLLTLCGDKASVCYAAMHDDLDIFRDPVFWGALFLGVLPMVLGGAVLVLR